MTCPPSAVAFPWSFPFSLSSLPCSFPFSPFPLSFPLSLPSLLTSLPSLAPFPLSLVRVLVLVVWLFSELCGATLWQERIAGA